ncbi:MAG: type II secretion system F family protein [Thermoplasmatota archaeon]
MAHKARDTALVTIGFILMAVLIGASVALLLGQTIGPVEGDHWIHLMSAGILAGIGPYGFILSARERNRLAMEDRFPDFLRDLAASHRGGLTLPAAIAVAARGDYGPLSGEIRKMADQLSWNVNFREALENFAQRVDAPLVARAVNLILEADRSGASTVQVLMAASRDVREIKKLDNERRVQMSLYTIVVYVAFFVLLGVVASMYTQFIPEVMRTADQVAGEDVPFLQDLPSLREFQLFYFLTAIVQAVGDGIVAGALGAGKPVLGLKHSFIMTAFTWLTFALIL